MAVVGVYTAAGKDVKMELRKGDKVNVTFKIEDHEIIERIATLITPLFTKARDREKWEVQFDGEPGEPIVYRFITVDNRI